MSKHSLWLLLFVGCSAGSKPAEPVPVTSPAAATPPSAGPVEPAPAVGEKCGDTTCKPLESCIHVSGMQEGSGRDECWITCADKACPAGLECTMVYDGPGRVCLSPDPD